MANGEKKQKVTFIAALEKAMKEGKKGDELIAAVKAAIPAYEEKRIKSRLNTAIKYIEGKGKPASKKEIVKKPVVKKTPAKKIAAPAKAAEPAKEAAPAEGTK